MSLIEGHTRTLGQKYMGASLRDRAVALRAEPSRSPPFGLPSLARSSPLLRHHAVRLFVGRLDREEALAGGGIGRDLSPRFHADAAAQQIGGGVLSGLFRAGDPLGR